MQGSRKRAERAGVNALSHAFQCQFLMGKCCQTDRESAERERAAASAWGAGTSQKSVRGPWQQLHFCCLIKFSAGPQEVSRQLKLATKKREEEKKQSKSKARNVSKLRRTGRQRDRERARQRIAATCNVQGMLAGVKDQ